MINLKLMKKGYLFVLFFALFNAATRTYYYRAFVAKDLSEASVNKLVIQAVILFALFAVPGLLLARWYYKHKNKMPWETEDTYSRNVKFYCIHNGFKFWHMTDRAKVLKKVNALTANYRLTKSTGLENISLKVGQVWQFIITGRRTTCYQHGYCCKCGLTL